MSAPAHFLAGVGRFFLSPAAPLYIDRGRVHLPLFLDGSTVSMPIGEEGIQRAADALLRENAQHFASPSPNSTWAEWDRFAAKHLPLWLLSLFTDLAHLVPNYCSKERGQLVAIFGADLICRIEAEWRAIEALMAGVLYAGRDIPIPDFYMHEDLLLFGAEFDHGDRSWLINKLTLLGCLVGTSLKFQSGMLTRFEWCSTNNREPRDLYDPAAHLPQRGFTFDLRDGSEYDGETFAVGPQDRDYCSIVPTPPLSRCPVTTTPLQRPRTRTRAAYADYESRMTVLLLGFYLLVECSLSIDEIRLLMSKANDAVPDRREIDLPELAIAIGDTMGGFLRRRSTDIQLTDAALCTKIVAGLLTLVIKREQVAAVRR